MSARSGLSVEWSVILPTFDRGLLLADTLRQLFGQADERTEILVVDQTRRHPEEARAFLERAASEGRIRWVKLAEPNVSRARNEGIRLAAGRCLLFLDDDVVLPEGFLAEHRRLLSRPGVSAVSGQVLRPGEKVVSDPDLVRRAARAAARGRFPTVLPNNYAVEADWYRTCGGNVSVTREAALRIGGYDERFAGSAFSEDCDFGWRLHRAGCRILFAPSAGLLHLEAPRGGHRSAGGDSRACRAGKLNAQVYFGVKHRLDAPWKYHWSLVRGSVLHKKNLGRPHLLVWWAWAYLRAWARAIRYRKRPLCPLKSAERDA